MNDEITVELFTHLVKLAALDLDQEESEYLRKQLNQQLNAIHELESIPVDEHLKITTHGVPYSEDISAKIREDVHRAYPNPKEILKQAPLEKENYIIVPEIPHEELE